MDTLQAYDKLQQASKLPKMHPGGVITKSQTFDDPQALWAAFESRQPDQGWLMFQSEQMAFHEGLPERRDDWGCLLCCEAVTAAGETLAIIQDGRGGWRLIESTADAEAPGLWDEVRQFAHAPGAGMLRYRRYWVDEQEQGFVQKHACFIGFE